MCVYLYVHVCGCVCNNNKKMCLYMYYDTLRHRQKILVVQKMKHTTLLVLLVKGRDSIA